MRRTVLLAAILNLTCFGVEFAVALAIGSVSLFADSIAECKYWRGEKEFLQAIDQLLSYLSWRDTKTAVLVFNRNAGFTEVLDKVALTVPKHRCFKRDLGKTDESSFRYVFHQPTDTNRELILSVLAFDVSMKEHPGK